MKADESDVKALTRIIERLEAALKANPKRSRRATLQRQLEDARALRVFIAKQAGIEIPN